MDWRVAYLRALGAKPTQPAMDFLAKWQPWEGGHTQNAASFNYLNTTQKMPGSTPINDVGVQAYRSLAQGAQAFAKTLLGMPEYGGLVSFLRTGQGDPSPGLQTWLSGSPTGGAEYAAKILGSTAAPTAPASPSTSNDAVPTSDFTPLTTPGVGDLVRQHAISGLSDIAQGKQPTDVFADTANFINQQSPALTKLTSSIPRIDIPTVDQGGSALDSSATKLVQKYLGVKYTWGGGSTAAGGFDCSGLVQSVWKQLGVNVPRTSQEQYKAGSPVENDLRPGDAVFFVGSDGTKDAPGHEGMYIGQGKFIEAPHSGAVVRVSTLAGRTDYVGARRFA